MVCTVFEEGHLKTRISCIVECIAYGHIWDVSLWDLLSRFCGAFCSCIFFYYRNSYIDLLRNSYIDLLLSCVNFITNPVLDALNFPHLAVGRIYHNFRLKL